jgi:hypothetical protein
MDGGLLSFRATLSPTVAVPPNPDDPTRPIPPAPPRPAVPVRERVVAADDELIAELNDHLRSFRRMLALVAVLSLAALGVALWALLADQEEDAEPGPPTATQQQFEDLDQRLSALENDFIETPTNADIARIDEERRALTKRVRDLATQFREAQESRVRPAAVEALEEDVTALTERVDELETSVDDLAAAADNTNADENP